MVDEVDEGEALSGEGPDLMVGGSEGKEESDLYEYPVSIPAVLGDQLGCVLSGPGREERAVAFLVLEE